MKLLIIGPQGAGKGTQAGLLCQRYEIPHVSTGDLFRSNIGALTPLGVLAKRYMDAGELVPDEVTQQMVADRLGQDDAQPGFLLDGFPRNPTQATWLDALLVQRGTPIDAVVVLTAPDDVLVARMVARGRDDDTVEAIQRRLAIYRSETQPLVDWYGSLVVSVDGVGAVIEVHERILAALDGVDGAPSGPPVQLPPDEADDADLDEGDDLPASG